MDVNYGFKKRDRDIIRKSRCRNTPRDAYHSHTAKCAHLHTSQGVIYTSKCVFSISFIKPSLLLASLILSFISSTHQHIWLSVFSRSAMIARNKKLCKNSVNPITSHVYHPWQVSPWWTGSRQRVPWTTQQRSQQPATQRISFMPNVKLSKFPPPPPANTAFLKDTYSTARSYLEIPSPPPIHWVVTTACSLQQI